MREEQPDLPPSGDLDTPDQLLEALKQNASLKSLTNGAEWGKLMAFVEEQVKKRKDALWMTTITAENRDDLNVMRGETLGLLLLEEYVKQQVLANDNVIELYKAEAKLQEQRDAG